MPAVDDHQKGLACGGHVFNRRLFRSRIVPAVNVRNGAVRGHHQPDGAVFLHNLFGAKFGGVGHGDLMVEPRGGDHSWLPVLGGAGGTFHHVAHRVDHPDPQPGGAVGADLHRLLGYKFWFGSHDGLAAAALGQLVTGPFPAIRIFDAGNHQLLHDPLDEGGLSRPHGAHHADVNIAPGPGGNVLVDSFHSKPPTSGRRTAPAMVFLYRVCPLRMG